MAEVKLRLNLDAEEVELVVDGKVAISSGQDVFHSWVEAYNAKHNYVVGQSQEQQPATPVEEKVVDVTTAETVSEEVDEEVDND